MPPGQLHDVLAPWPRELHISADVDRGTCRRPDGTFATLDYAVSDARAVFLIKSVEAREDVPLAPHRAVQVYLRASAAAKRVETWRKPRPADAL